MKRSWPDFKILSLHSHGESEEKQERPHDSRSSVRDFSPKPDYEGPRRSVRGVCDALV
jgi:hypothetical protein